MTPQIETSVEGRLGVIALNRPEAINALSRDMIDGIGAVLTAWRDDSRISTVLFEGRGSRGFCSGGDVRAARTLVLAGKAEQADEYFAAEYAMNLLIATYAKPIAAIGHGVVMGGGVGIFGHARCRFAATGARFAMPEAAIGFVCDVGVNALLAQVPEPRALAFLLPGLAVGAGDALELGLTDAAIPSERIDAVRAGIVAAAAATDPEAALVRLMEAESIDAGAATLSVQADGLAAEFSAATAAEIGAALARRAASESGLDALAAALAGRSPTSLEAILQSHRAARRSHDVATVLQLDLALAGYMARQPDFAEGVRALLVDKDQRPAWRPATAADVDRGAIVAVVREATAAVASPGSKARKLSTS